MKSITGKVVYKNIGTGCWGIIDNNGKEWRPINLPEQLKKEGRKVQVIAEEEKENFSVFMWGTAIKIVSFHT